MSPNYIGVDLSSKWIDIHDPHRGQIRITNTPRDLVRWMKTLTSEDFLVFEATSGCDRSLGLSGEQRGREFDPSKINDLTNLYPDFGQKPP